MSDRHNQPWTPAAAADLYGIDGWGAGFFTIDNHGNLAVTTRQRAKVALKDIVTGALERGHATPLLLRIENILEERIRQLQHSFTQAIATHAYTGSYHGVFPVKVNQHQQVVSEIIRCCAPYACGLEAGSKAELALALAAAPPDGDDLLILNGYKDRQFIDLGLWAHKLGRRCFFVVESLSELHLLLTRALALGIRPRLGARIKLAVKVAGMWTETSGDRSSFGLDSRQLVAMIDILRRHNMLDCLQLLHCHIGSQIPSLNDIRAGVRAASHYYRHLLAEGAAMGYIDFGGGLAVDYGGTASDASYSCNYTLAEYADAIVAELSACLDDELPQPHIITESGRALVAHASLLVFDVIDVAHFEAVAVPQHLDHDAAPVLRQMLSLYRQALISGGTEHYATALQLREELRSCFQRGTINLRQRALGEDLFLAVAQQVANNCAAPELRAQLADIYYGNFSVFQSLPDTWAIGQYFPVVPLQRLDEQPQREAIIADLTCDCDGKLDSFIVGGQQRTTLPLHQPLPDEAYYLGVFMMGAYQETLGDIHNLFGDTHIVSVRINDDGSFAIQQEIDGDSVADVLHSVHYDARQMVAQMRTFAEQQVRSGHITVAQRRQMLEQFCSCLNDYTYYRTTI